MTLSPHPLPTSLSTGILLTDGAMQILRNITS